MKQGFTPDFTAIPNVEPDLHSPNQSCFDQNTSHNTRLSPVGSLLAKNVLFACSRCDGPLVPSSFCIICKKTALRSCIRCGTIRDMGLHDSCKNLVILGNEVSSHSLAIKKGAQQ